MEIAFLYTAMLFTEGGLRFHSFASFFPRFILECSWAFEIGHFYRFQFGHLANKKESERENCEKDIGAYINIFPKS
jgi:hypothetical protein